MKKLSSILQRVLSGVRLRVMGAPAKHWNDVERFESDWKTRIALMAEHIPSGASVVDFGCGPMWLKEYLVDGSYAGVDYVSRGDGTIVCDFNVKEFPEIEFDVAFVSGCLEYIVDFEWFIRRVATQSRLCILSYCTIDEFPIVSDRKDNAWVNNLSRDNIVSEFRKNNMVLSHETMSATRNSIFVFRHL